jgi:hypothetical protein
MSDLHASIPVAADRFVFNQETEAAASLKSVTPGVPATLTFFRPNRSDASISVDVPGRPVAMVTTKAKLSTLRARVGEALDRVDRDGGLRLFVNNGIVNNGTINVLTTCEDANRSAFVRLRDVVMHKAVTERLRKLGGRIMRPRAGAACSYDMCETYREFLNVVLEGHAAYHERPAMQRELVEYITNYNPPSMRDLEVDRRLIAFDNGVLELPGEFSPTMSIAFHVTGGEAMNKMVEEGRVASHHIAGEYPIEGAHATPLFDSVLLSQMSTEVMCTLKALLGRLHFPVGLLDNWQILPYLIGVGGTGKSVVQDVAAATFSKAMQATLTGNQEATFGLDGKYDKHVLFGRDLPRTMTKVLLQELLQSMVSGEDVCVPRKGLVAENVRWQAPMLFGSNYMPDYCDDGSQISRRIVAFMFDHPILQPDPTLMQRVVALELPSLLRQFLEEYLDAVRLHRDEGFWNWCPEALGAARREVEVATSYVKRFLALTRDSEEAVTDEGGIVFPVLDSAAATPLQAVVAAYTAFIRSHHKGQEKGGEKMNRGALAKCGFTVEEHNVCKACGKIAAVGCCASYASANRKRCMVVFGLALVHEEA